MKRNIFSIIKFAIISGLGLFLTSFFLSLSYGDNHAMVLKVGSLMNNINTSDYATNLDYDVNYNFLNMTPTAETFQINWTYCLMLNKTEHCGKSMTVSDEVYTTLSNVTDYVNLTMGNARQHVFATAANSAYFKGTLLAIESIYKYFPGYLIYYWDLGLTDDEANHIEELKHVTLKKFPFYKYPHHVRDHLKAFAWKSLVVMEVLRHHPGVFYVDSSVRFKSGYTESNYQQVVTSGGFLFNSFTGHSSFPVTHPALYTYLPTNMSAMMTLKQYEGGDILVYRTRTVYKSVLIPWTLCSLYKPCIAPTLERFCAVKNWTHYAGCHRFDQSTMNLLVQNYIGYTEAVVAEPNVVRIERGAD